MHPDRPSRKRTSWAFGLDKVYRYPGKWGSVELETRDLYSRAFAYVTSSRYRQKVLENLADGPKRPKQLSEALVVGQPHVSRALRELRSHGLVVRLTGGLPKSRFYELTEPGKSLAGEIAKAKGTLGVVPLHRGTHIYNYTKYLRRHYGEGVAQEILRAANIKDPVHPDLWYPLQMGIDFLEAMENRLGDGSYDLIRKAASEIVVEFPSIKQLLSRALSIEMFCDMAPKVYCQEFNHGRLEVNVEVGKARFYLYEWVSSEAKCAALQGTFEGLLRARKATGKVTKFGCIRAGDESCAYLVEWS